MEPFKQRLSIDSSCESNPVPLNPELNEAVPEVPKPRLVLLAPSKALKGPLRAPCFLGFPFGNPGILASLGTQLGTQGAILGLF